MAYSHSMPQWQDDIVQMCDLESYIDDQHAFIDSIRFSKHLCVVVGV